MGGLSVGSVVLIALVALLILGRKSCRNSEKQREAHCVSLKMLPKD